MDDVVQCINILQSTAWKINGKVLDVMRPLYHDEGGGIAGLPPKEDLPMPSSSEFEGGIDDEGYQYKVKAIKKVNAEQHSLRCDLTLKMDLAQQLREEEAIYFPLNIDFRGRVYPISPHVNHIGSDTVRGMMMFSKKKRLGERGWFWLNVNLANKFGFDKVPNRERFEWALQRKEKVLKVAQDPLSNRWWLSADSPFQALSVCLEIGSVYRFVEEAEDREFGDFESSLPVGQDGSCNGLQHYAAMLRDEKMAQFVNVADNQRYGLGRGDVYSAVRQCVANMVDDDVRKKGAKNPNYRLAKLLDGKITRKIVKQTVMTSVYGVTSYGAKGQILRWLEDAVDGGTVELKDENDTVFGVHSFSLYLSLSQNESLWFI